MIPLQLTGDVSIDELKGLVGQLQSLIDKSERPKVTMTLMAFLKDVYLISRIDMTLGSQQQLQITVELFDRWHGRPVTLSELTPELVTAHLKHFLDLGKSPSTVESRRLNIISLWNAAARQKLVRRLIDPKEIPRPKKKHRQPQAWWLDELTQLLDECQRLHFCNQNQSQSKRSQKK